jgi:hypothetical protein
MSRLLPRKRSEWDIVPIRDQVTDLAIADATNTEYVEPEEDFAIMNKGEDAAIDPGALADPSDKTLIMEVLQDEFSSSFENELEEFEEMLEIFDEGPEPLEESPTEKLVAKEPWNDAWEIIARRLAYDISNFYEEGPASPKNGPVSIEVDVKISTQQWSDSGTLEDIQDYMQKYLKKTLNMKPEHHLIVTIETVPEVSEEDLPIDVNVSLNGIDPDKMYDLELLVQGLVYEAIQHFKG